MIVNKLMSVMPAILLLAACSSDSSTAPGSAVKIIAESGATVDLTGTWMSACYSSDGIYRRDIHTYAADQRAVSHETYGAADTTCAGTKSTVQDLTVTGITVSSTKKTLSGWVDGSGTVTSAPNSQAGPALTTTALVSKHTGTYNSNTVKLVLVIDDSVASSWVMYRDYDKAHLDAEGYPSYVTTADPLFKK